MDDILAKGRLAYIVGDVGNGGQERQLLYLLRQLKPLKEDITVIVWDFREEDYHAQNYKDLGLDLVFIDKRKPLVNRILQLRKIMRTRKPVILHSFTFYLNFFCWLSCLALKTIPVGGIRSRLSLHLSEVGTFFFYLCTYFPKYKISNNEYYDKGFRHPFIRRTKKHTYTVTNHLDLSAFLPNIPSVTGAIKTASISRYTEEKRIDWIVDIIKELKSRNIDIIHSHAGKGPLMNNIREKIEADGLESDFILYGEMPDINMFLADKHIFIHASHTEGYPNVIMEAMACAKPVVTSNCGDVSQMVENGESGFVHEIDDISGLINSCELLARDENKRYEFALKSRSIAEEKFNLDHLLQQTVNTYKKICAE